MHPHMALNIEECIDQTHLKEKTTIVIPTSNSPLECLIWSTFSILLRSKPGSLLEHFCICVNGPDERTGDPSLQDKKQAFLEDLRDVEWFHKNEPNNRKAMPMTLIRAWSRVGYAESFEMALGWIHTDSYLLMHDDVIIINPEWCSELKEKFYSDPNISLASVPPLLGHNCDSSIHKGMYLLRLPQLETTFLAVKKRWILKAGATWTGYHVPSEDNFLQFDLQELPNMEEFFDYYRYKGLMPDPVQTTELYNYVRQEVGAWIFYKLLQAGSKFADLDSKNIIHLKKMSNTEPVEEKQRRVEENKEEISKLEKEILGHPIYSEIYKKHMPGGVRYA